MKTGEHEGERIVEPSGTVPVALVAGGSGGIGASICASLAHEGFDIALTYLRSADAAELAAKAVRDHGRTASTHRIDLTDPAQPEQLIASLPRLDTVVYAAGPKIPMRYVSGVEPGQFVQQLVADAAGCFNLLSPAIAPLRETKGTAVCLVTTALRRYASRDLLSAAPKGAVEQLARAIAAEEGKYGVRVNCVGVGVIQAGLWEDLLSSGDYDERALSAARAATALRRFGQASEVADVVAFLAGSRSSYVTGQTLCVDGGYSL
jgi:NAD(P)-dependent dehydrogenase (short-subunit alcohol dehydrogenase family)